MSNPFQDPQKDKDPTIGNDQRLAMAKVGANDAPFQSDEQSLFMPKAATNVRNYAQHRKDFMPTTGTTTVTHGQYCTFKIGNEGMSNLVAAELYIHLPAVVDSGAASKHPTDPTYAGAGTYMQWAPYTAERFLAGSGEPFTMYFGTEKLRSVTAEGLNVKRTLCHDTEGTNKRAAYCNAVGAVSDDTSVDRWFFIPLWLPHSTDDVNMNQLLPIQVFATEMRWQFKVPTLAQLIQTDVVTANIAALSTASYPSTSPEVFIRCHYITTEKAERGMTANLTLQPKGLSFQTMHIAREVQFPLTTSVSQDVSIPIRNFMNPCAFMAFIVRITDDTLANGATADHTDNATLLHPQRSPLGIVRRPEWSAYKPWNWVGVYDGGNRVTPHFSQNTQQNSLCEGLATYFPGDITTNIGVCVFSVMPTVENNGLGHINFTTMTNALVKINVPAVNSSEEGVSPSIGRVIDAFSFERNFWHAKNGNQVRIFNVQD